MAKGNKKPILFISHISEEKEAASLLKDFFEHAFLGAIEVFVSSNEKSITYGARWLDRITNALQSCDTMLVLCSAKSVQRRGSTLRPASAAREVLRSSRSAMPGRTRGSFRRRFRSTRD